MAGDWMKMRTNLWDDPRVVRIVDLTDSCEAMVIGGLYWLWSMADKHTENGWLPGMSLRQIDRKSGVAGLGAALESIGWLETRDDGVMLVRFDDHNGKSAKKRCQTASRVAKHKSGNAVETQGSEAGNADSVTKSDGQRYPEKRREEKSSTPDTSQQAPEISERATLAGQACVLMRQAGCFTTNPSHPDLQAAIAEGVTPQALADTVAEGLARAPPVAKPFAWAISTARARHAEGPRPAPISTGGPNANHHVGSAGRTDQLHQEFLSGRREQGGGGGLGGDAGEVIDGVFSVVH